MSGTLWMIFSTEPAWISRFSLCSCYLGCPCSLQQISKGPSDATGSNMGYRHSPPATAESNFTQWESNIQRAGARGRLPPVYHYCKELFSTVSGTSSLHNEKQKQAKLKSVGCTGFPLNIRDLSLRGALLVSPDFTTTQGLFPCLRR